MKQPARLAPEHAYTAEWTSPCEIDPFGVPVGEQVGLLLAIDAELRRTAGSASPKASMHFERRRQVFVSTLGSVIDQTRYLSGAGFSALCYKDDEIQKRSYPNSFGGQYQMKGYELVDELRPARKMRRASPKRPWRCTRPTSARRASST